MTPRDRMLAMIRGEPQDQVPFVQYDQVNGFPDRAEVQALVGAENVGFVQWVMPGRVVTPDCDWHQEPVSLDGLQGYRRVLTTPMGQLQGVWFLDPILQSSACAEHFVKAPGDYEILLAYLDNAFILTDLAPVANVIDDLGEAGLPHLYTGRTPYQQLWIEWVSAERLIPDMAEYPDLLEEVTGKMASLQRGMFQAAREAITELDIPYVVIGDNITAPMIGPTFFVKYCVPQYKELACMLDVTGRDIPVVVHMDGDLKALWPHINDSGVMGIDSLSPPPDNDTSVADVRSQWPDMRCMVNFPSSVHLQDTKSIYRITNDILEQASRSGRLQIQISENVPPCIWRTSYPPIIQAIIQHGAVG